MIVEWVERKNRRATYEYQSYGTRKQRMCVSLFVYTWSFVKAPTAH